MTAGELLCGQRRVVSQWGGDVYGCAVVLCAKGFTSRPVVVGVGCVAGIGGYSWKSGTLGVGACTLGGAASCLGEEEA